MNNNFFKALEYEKSQQKKADDFYKKHFGDNLIEIKRWDYNEDERSKKMQLMGIDVTITVKFTGRTFNNVDKDKLNCARSIEIYFDMMKMLLEHMDDDLKTIETKRKSWKERQEAEFNRLEEDRAIRAKRKAEAERKAIERAEKAQEQE